MFLYTIIVRTTFKKSNPEQQSTGMHRFVVLIVVIVEADEARKRLKHINNLK